MRRALGRLKSTRVAEYAEPQSSDGEQATAARGSSDSLRDLDGLSPADGDGTGLSRPSIQHLSAADLAAAIGTGFSTEDLDELDDDDAVRASLAARRLEGKSMADLLGGAAADLDGDDAVTRKTTASENISGNTPLAVAQRDTSGSFLVNFETEADRRKFNRQRAFYGAALTVIERKRPKEGLALTIRVKFLPVLWLIVDYFQITSVIYSTPFCCDLFAKWFFSVLTINFESYELWTFMFALTSVFIIIMGLTYLPLMYFREKRPNQVLANTFSTFLSLIISLLYVPTLRSLFSIYRCTQGQWIFPPHFSCWTGPHIGLVLLSVPAALVFMAVCLTVSQNAFEIDPHAPHILRRWHGRFDFVYICCKTIVVFAITFSTNDNAKAVTFAFLFFLLFSFITKMQPYYVHQINSLRIGLHLAMVFSTICNIIATFDAPHQWISIMYWSGVVFVVAGGAAVGERRGFQSWLRPPDPESLYGRYFVRPCKKLEIGSSPAVIHRLKLGYLVKSATRLGRMAHFVDTELNDPDLAGYYYNKALAADPRNPTNLGNYANYVARAMGDADEADRLYQFALDLQSRHIQNLGYYANFLTAVKKTPKEADEYYLRAVDLDPAHQNYLSLYSASSDGLLIMDTEGQCLDCNGALLRLFEGTTREAFSKHKLFDLSSQQAGGDFLGAGSTDMADIYLGACQNTGRVRFEWKFRKIVTGVEFMADVLMTAVELGGLKLVQASITDVTERKHAEAELQDREDHMRQIQERTTDGIISIDSDGIVKYLNPAVEAMFGYDMFEVVGKKVNMLMFPADAEMHDEYIAKYIEESTERDINSSLRQLFGRRKDNAQVVFQMRLNQVHIGGRIVVTGVLTEQNERSEVTKMIVASSPDAIVVIDSQCSIYSFNSGAHQLFGWSEKEVIGKNVSLLLPPEYAAVHDQYVHRYVDTGVSRVMGSTRELVAMHRSGETMLVNQTLSEVRFHGAQFFVATMRRAVAPMTAQGNKLAFSMQVAPSVTSLHRAMHMIDRASDPVISVSARGIVLLVNNAAEDAFGYLADDLVGQLLPDSFMDVPFHQDEELLVSGDEDLSNPPVMSPAMHAAGSHALANDGLAPPSSLAHDRETSLGDLLSHVATSQQSALDDLGDEFALPDMPDDDVPSAAADAASPSDFALPDMPTVTGGGASTLSFAADPANGPRAVSSNAQLDSVPHSVVRSTLSDEFSLPGMPSSSDVTPMASEQALPALHPVSESASMSLPGTPDVVSPASSPEAARAAAEAPSQAASRSPSAASLPRSTFSLGDEFDLPAFDDGPAGEVGDTGMLLTSPAGSDLELPEMPTMDSSDDDEVGGEATHSGNRLGFSLGIVRAPSPADQGGAVALSQSNPGIQLSLPDMLGVKSPTLGRSPRSPGATPRSARQATMRSNLDDFELPATPRLEMDAASAAGSDMGNVDAPRVRTVRSKNGSEQAYKVSVTQLKVGTMTVFSAVFADPNRERVAPSAPGSARSLASRQTDDALESNFELPDEFAVPDLEFDDDLQLPDFSGLDGVDESTNELAKVESDSTRGTGPAPVTSSPSGSLTNLTLESGDDSAASGSLRGGVLDSPLFAGGRRNSTALGASGRRKSVMRRGTVGGISPLLRAKGASPLNPDASVGKDGRDAASPLTLASEAPADDASADVLSPPHSPGALDRLRAAAQVVAATSAGASAFSLEDTNVLVKHDREAARKRRRRKRSVELVDQDADLNALELELLGNAS